MNPSVSHMVLSILLLGLALYPASGSVDRWLVGHPGDAQIETGSGLLLMGGGGDVDAAMRWFLTLVEGGDVVVLRASGSDGYNDYLFRELGVGLDSVETLRFNRREDAFDPDAAETIRNAEAIFLAGGDQSRYVAFWKGTPVGESLNQHLESGKPMGGTSAGLAVLGEFVYSAMHEGDLTSALALGDPTHPFITIEDGFLRTPLLKGVLTDSHFSERDRLGRLIVMLARTVEATGRHDLLGLGIDEQTALCVGGDGSARVVSVNGGGVTLVTLPGEPLPVRADAPFGPVPADLVVLGPGSGFCLPSREVDRPVSIARIVAAEGRLQSDQVERN